MTTRRQRLADEIGSANVVIVADAYRQGWLAAIAAARLALRGDSDGQPVPSSVEALRGWLVQDTPRLRFSWRAEEVVTAVHNDEIVTADPEETPT